MLGVAICNRISAWLYRGSAPRRTLVYLCILLAALARQPQISQGVYLAVGGIAIFSIGVLLSIYRERLLALPDKMAKREGIFKIISWR